MAVLVPWAPGDAHREAAWSRLKARHLAVGRTVIEGRCDGPWVKALAVADALRRTDDDLLIVHDADVWSDGLDQAIAQVNDGCRWAIPHRNVYRLAPGRSEPSTDPVDLDPANRYPYEGTVGGGIVVLRRDTYNLCPLDPRFVGWGHEDDSWGHALTVLFGAPWRGDAPLFHWWHPPQERRTRSRGSVSSEVLGKRYQRAAGIAVGRRLPPDRRAMVDLIGEMPWPPSTSSAPTATASNTS